MAVIGIFIKCLSAQLKTESFYRVNFIIGLVSQVIFSLLSIAFVGAFMNGGLVLAGWHFADVLFLLGFSDITFGLSAILFFRAFLIFDPVYLLDGELDHLLLQPIHPLLNLILRNASSTNLIIVLKGVVITGIAARLNGFPFTAVNLALLAGAVLIGTTAYAGIFLLFMAIGFWFPRRSSISAPLLSLNMLAQFPLTVYPEWLQVFLTFLLPLGFVSFYPVQAALGFAALVPAAGLSWLLLIAVPLLSLALGISAFSIGLRKYESVGN